MWCMQGAKNVVAHKVEHNRDDVRHYTVLPPKHLYVRPSLSMAIQSDEQCRRQNGEDVHQQRHLTLVRPGKQRQIAKQKQNHQPYNGKIKRGEQHAHHLSTYQYVFVGNQESGKLNFSVSDLCALLPHSPHSHPVFHIQPQCPCKWC